MCPIFQDLKPFFKIRGLVCWNGQNIDGFIKAGIGIQVVTKFDPYALQVRNNVIFLEIFCAIESHVLGHVRQTLLIIILHDGANLYDQAQFYFFLWLFIFPYIIGKTVLELTGDYFSIKREF